MTESNQVELKLKRIYSLPLDKYDKNFTFIVNGEEFESNRIIADLLSPKICKLHIDDPTITEFIIETENKGNFQNVLNLVNFKKNSILANEMPFICEVIEKLGSESIEIYTPNFNESATLDNVLEKIKMHKKYSHLYSSQYEQDIDFISTNFFNLTESNEETIFHLGKDTIERIISNPNLVLDSESQLLKFINQLYYNNHEYATFYEYVDFLNVSEQDIGEFISIFMIDDITTEMWRGLSCRLQKEINKNENIKFKHNHRYLFPYVKGKEFTGIFNFFRNALKGYFNENIKVESSSINNSSESFVPSNCTLFESQSNVFASNDLPNSWISFNFGKYRIIPNCYTIRSSQHKMNALHLKSWVIEGSNDNENWTILDTRQNDNFLNGNSNMATYNINNESCKSFYCLRLRMTGPNHGNNNILYFHSIEFYGGLL